MEVLIVDIGGSAVKLALGTGARHTRCASSSTFTPEDLMQCVIAETSAWTFDVVSMGVPGRVVDGRPVAEPGNLGTRLGRIRFRASGRQALSYRQRRSDAGAGRLRRWSNALPRARNRHRFGRRHVKTPEHSAEPCPVVQSLTERGRIGPRVRAAKHQRHVTALARAPEAPHLLAR